MRIGKRRRKTGLYLLGGGLLSSVVFAAPVAVIPSEYHANYQFADAWEGIVSTFKKIDATKSTGTDFDRETFVKLSQYFNQVFPHLPQKGEFRTIYEQCRIITHKLTQSYSHESLDIFSNKCQNSLSKAMSQMNAQYTIKPKIKTNPSSGNAPLSVTFNAKESVDPSNDTIPSANYFRYYKDTKGHDQVIGQGIVVNHTFTEPGAYQVHLTVRSVNQRSEGILDGEQTTTVSVSPKTARMRIFANGKQLDEHNPTRIGTAEAQKGIVFDAKATVPTGGRSIENHKWLITQGSKKIYEKKIAGTPDVISTILPAEGTFTVALTILDNQGNTMTKTYKLVVSDPLAIIKASPEQGDTSTKFTFDGSASYSIVSTIKLYTREIFDENNKKINTFQGKSINKQFAKPGSYTVSLVVEDEQKRVNRDTFQVYVESTPPQAQFSFTPTNDRQHPSQFVFDAGLSSDIDIINADDKLRYQWRFTPEQYVETQSVIDGGRQIIASFNKPGEYQAKLTVQDSFGKTSEVIKTIKIDAALRPVIHSFPKATNRGTPITMVVRNENPSQPLISYEWDFGDGKKESVVGTPSVTHTYDKVGAYTVKLKVNGPDNQENTVTNMVFIGEKGKPTPAFMIKDGTAILKQTAECPEGPAYPIDRRKNFTIDTALSINTKGETNKLQTYMQPQGSDIFEKRTMQYKFQELGCQFIDITVQDNENNKTATTRARFNVVNALPTIKDITLSFPQYGGGATYGFNVLSFGQNTQGLEPNKKPDDVFSTEVFDPLVVQVTAQGVSDPDGVVSYYKRYYYKKENPNRLLQVKITPASVSTVSFTLDRIGGEYEFGVTMIDNDEGESRSVDILGGGRGVYFPADTNNVNMPIVTLKQSHSNIEAGDEVTFEVKSKLILEKKDFRANRVIKYDFDGDGIPDLITKDTKVTHTYRKPGEFTPKVSVVYRENKGFDVGESITVQQSVKPLMYITQHGPYMLARDISIGSIIESKVCVDARRCVDDPTLTFNLGKKENSDHKTLVHRYAGTGTYFVDIQIKDDLGQEAGRKYPVTVKHQESVPFFHLMSIPEAKQQNENYTIAVGNQLGNTVSYLLQYAGNGKCFMDTDPSKDANGDGKADNDEDVRCNELVSIAYDGKQTSRTAKIYYTQNEQQIVRDVVINFIDAKNVLEPKQQLIYTKLGTIIATIPKEKEKDIYLRHLLVQLQSSLDDRTARGGFILDIEQLLQSGETSIADAERNQLEAIMNEMKDAAIIAAEGGTPYDQAKADILMLATPKIRPQVEKHFAKIESKDIGGPEKIKAELQQIIKLFMGEQKAEEIDVTDMNSVLMPKICRIMEYYKIDTNSKACLDLKAKQKKNGGYTPVVPDEDGKKEGSGVAGTIIKRILIVVGILLVVFGGLVGFFVIKAKRAQAGQAE